jgi:hypothetical protein
MSTWWEERAAVVTEAIAMVAAQRQCGHADAIAFLRRRFEQPTGLSKLRTEPNYQRV